MVLLRQSMTDLVSGEVDVLKMAEGSVSDERALEGDPVDVHRSPASVEEADIGASNGVPRLETIPWTPRIPNPLNAQRRRHQLLPQPQDRSHCFLFLSCLTRKRRRTIMSHPPVRACRGTTSSTDRALPTPPLSRRHPTAQMDS